ncbi:hypothetical protein [Streptomyces iconiensis]|uniref:Transposase (putative) YhgA-like domain-containing protein n=1 Tax=Streptomyces iconiensis TaxID=1384038 RepID=A0ABT6ZZY8_9ACTN|nr:hypothetical protein [Streptomyces iconiensis]MDJ1134646.1 hypothetical protein [Streptomyces iconiensis]
MVNSPHEAHHRVFQEVPQLVRRAFALLDLPDPGDAEVTVLNCDVTEIQPVERRVDTLLNVKCPDGRAYPLIIEAQSKKDPEKALSWAYYLSFLASKYKTHHPTLLVVCRDKVTADWARGPFTIGPPSRPNLMVSPLVLGPHNVPVIMDANRAAADLPLTVFSALTHSADDRIGEILEVLAMALKQTTDRDMITLYADLTANGLGDSPAAELWRKLVGQGLFDLRGFVAEGLRDEGREEGRQVGHTEGLEQGLEQGRQRGLQEGRQEGRIEMLCTVLEKRGLEISDEEKGRITSCKDSELLGLWLVRAVTATTADEIFADPTADENPLQD